MSEIRKASKDALIYGLVSLFPISLGFISIPIYTRLFNPTEYGQLSIAQLTANYVALFLFPWLSASFLRFYEAYKKINKEKEFVGNYIALLFALSLSSLLIYAILLFFIRFFNVFNDTLFRILIISAFLMFFNGFMGFLQNYYRTKRESKNYATVAIGNSFFTLVAGLLLVLIFGFGVEGILLGSASVSGVIAIIAMVILIKKYSLSSIKFDKDILKEALVYGSPVIFSGFANWMLRFADRYIIQISRDSSEVGIYSVSYGISEKTIMLIITAIAFSVMPTLIFSWEHNGKKATEKLLKQFTRYQFILLLPATLGLIILAPQFMSLLVGEGFREGVTALRFVAAGVFFLGLYNLTNVGLFINKMTKTVARNVLIVGAVNIILNLITVPIFGYIAAAVNTLISYILLWLMSYFQTKNILRWSIDSRSFLRIVLSATVMSVILLIISGFVSSTWILITLIFLSIFIYFGTLLALGEIKKEFEYLLQYFKRKLSNVK